MTTSLAFKARYHTVEVGRGSAQNNYVWPQVQHMGADYRWDEPDSVTSISSNRPLVVHPNLNSFHLHDSTEITDLISQAYIRPIGLLASREICVALCRHIIQAHRSYAAHVVHHGRSFPYQWLHMTELAEDRIDYSKSVFRVLRRDRPEEPIRIIDRDALQRTTVELANTLGGSLSAKVIAFHPGTPRFDLFALSLPDKRFFVSPRLAKELTSRRFTGFDMSPADTTIVFEQAVE